MTFNIRFDGIEHDPNNHFTKRVYRLTETIEKWQPSILNVQEPFANQLLHWRSHLPTYYQYIGYQPDGIDRNLEHPSSHWNSSGAQTLNITRFHLKNDDQSINILVFNTHLHVKSEQARQEQTKIIRLTIEQWQKKYPTAVVLLFGDFNSVPKQAAYNILTSSDFLHDTWTIANLRHLYVYQIHFRQHIMVG
ncbi:unnamed protein product [Rotaria sp. Silwood1]|nr:unnamed protein product [Rotaria sp. Silwood1]CAF4982558.1 unnamed protein product [Rotaria sp. Silwood1]